MTLTRRISDIQNPGVRVPIWTVYFTFYLMPDILMSAWLDRHRGAPRLFSGRMLFILWTTFLFGVDGTREIFKD